MRVYLIVGDGALSIDIAPAPGAGAVAFAAHDYPDPTEAIVALIERHGPAMSWADFEAIDHALDRAEQRGRERLRTAARELVERKPESVADAVARVALEPDAPLVVGVSVTEDDGFDLFVSQAIALTGDPAPADDEDDEEDTELYRQDGT
jgi:hypothetical protein